MKRGIGGWLLLITSHSVTEGQRVLCVLNFPHAYDMQAGNLVENKGFLCFLISPCMLMRDIYMHEGNLEDKGYISLLHEQWGKYEVYIPWENKRIRGDHGIIETTTRDARQVNCCMCLRNISFTLAMPLLTNIAHELTKWLSLYNVFVAFRLSPPFRCAILGPVSIL